MSWDSSGNFGDRQPHHDSGVTNSWTSWTSEHQSDHNPWNSSHEETWDAEWNASPPKKTCPQAGSKTNSSNKKSPSKMSQNEWDEWAWGPSPQSTTSKTENLKSSKPSSVIVPADRDPSEMTAEEWDAWAWGSTNTASQPQLSDSNPKQSDSKPKEPMTTGSLYDPPDASNSSGDSSWGNMRQMCAEMEKKRLASLVPIVKSLYKEHASVSELSDEQVVLCS